jgi:hypothetical protein
LKGKALDALARGDHVTAENFVSIIALLHDEDDELAEVVVGAVPDVPPPESELVGRSEQGAPGRRSSRFGVRPVEAVEGIGQLGTVGADAGASLGVEKPPCTGHPLDCVDLGILTMTSGA